MGGRMRTWVAGAVVALLAGPGMPRRAGAEGGVSPWARGKNSVIAVMQRVEEGTLSEVGAGFEFSAPDPFSRERASWEVREVPSKLFGRYRVGAARHSYTAPGRTPGSTVATELTLVTLGFGYDYAFYRRRASPFVSAHLIGVLPFRDDPLPARDDDFRSGIGVGGGFVAPFLLGRIEYQWLEGDSDIVLAGMGFRF